MGGASCSALTGFGGGAKAGAGAAEGGVGGETPNNGAG
jgi:hypothetical protein